ncbi:hypothetical protein DXG01_000532 [Tephrocybe rancida]|nr:hypothetical protein DXG01_000532 [Tephrocybe rancida]
MATTSREAQNAQVLGATESTPLLSSSVNERDTQAPKSDDAPRSTMFSQEFLIIPRYAFPVCCSQMLELSMVLVPVVSIGHLSTTALAAVSLGSMTANVTGLSILQGLASALDTVLPSAYTSPQPHLVGLWAQRMACGFNSISRQYFQSQGLFYIQTRIICIVAPVNVLVNYLLVWGPESIRLGFIGAPIASALSICLISVTALVHGVYLVPRTAWHPLSMKMFTNLGLLARLGLSGIGENRCIVS